MRHLLTGFLVCTLLLGGAGISLVESPAGAGSVDDAKRKVGQIADQLEAAEEEVDRLSEELAIAVENKRQLEVEIVSTEVEIAAKQTELGGVQGQMSDLAIEAFVGGGRRKYFWIVGSWWGPKRIRTTSIFDGNRIERWSSEF